MASQPTPGARWLRCDLHVHTPFDGEKKFGEDVRGAVEAYGKGKPEALAMSGTSQPRCLNGHTST